MVARSARIDQCDSGYWLSMVGDRPAKVVDTFVGFRVAGWRYCDARTIRTTGRVAFPRTPVAALFFVDLQRHGAICVTRLAAALRFRRADQFQEVDGDDVTLVSTVCALMRVASCRRARTVVHLSEDQIDPVAWLISLSIRLRHRRLMSPRAFPATAPRHEPVIGCRIRSSLWIASLCRLHGPSRPSKACYRPEQVVFSDSSGSAGISFIPSSDGYRLPPRWAISATRIIVVAGRPPDPSAAW